MTTVSTPTKTVKFNMIDPTDGSPKAIFTTAFGRATIIRRAGDWYCIYAADANGNFLWKKEVQTELEVLNVLSL